MRSALLLLCGIAVLGLSVGCGGGSVSRSPSNSGGLVGNEPGLTPLGGTIVGRVIDLQTGAGVSSASLRARLLPEETGISLTGVSDANGRFTFSKLSPGTWELRASKVHFGDGSANVQVFPITISQMDLALVNQGGQD